MSSESKNKAIIAMKGPPFTRKSQFASCIAASLKCPLLSLEDFLDVLNPISFQSFPSCKLQDVAFQIICRIAKSHLSSGLFKQVIIDSRLSSRSQLDQLIELASYLDVRLVIIECKAGNVYEWQTIFLDYMEKNRYSDQVHKKWYKPKNWEDVKKAIRDGYDERSDGYKVSKLLLDPILDYQNVSRGNFFIDAVNHMISRNDNEEVLWRMLSLEKNLNKEEESYAMPMGSNKSESSKVDQQEADCSVGSGHYITEYIDEGVEFKGECRACFKPIAIGAAYSCEHCSFALHKDCAELVADHSNLESLVRKVLIHGYYLDFAKDESRCKKCSNRGVYSDSCGDCIFIAHFNNKVLPTIVRRDFHTHFLSILIKDVNPEADCSCDGCGENISDAIWYTCKICGVDYHYECLDRATDLASAMNQLRVQQEAHNMLMQYRLFNNNTRNPLLDLV